MVERFNQTIERHLAKLVNSHQKDWDKYIPIFLLSYRTAVHESAEVTPAYATFGRELRLPADLITGGPPGMSNEITDNYLLRLEQFESAIKAYNEALRWNNNDVKSLLGRSMARSKATYYDEALEDAERAAELEPNNMTAKEIRAQTEYEKCNFEKALVLALRGQLLRTFPNHMENCVRHAEETVAECTGASAGKVLSYKLCPLDKDDLISDEGSETQMWERRPRFLQEQVPQTGETPLGQKQRRDQISRLMASMYLGRMACDKYFLTALYKDERLTSANIGGSEQLVHIAGKALTDIECRQAVLRERRPLYAAQASGEAARARLARARKEGLTRAQKQHTRDAQRLIISVRDVYNQRDTNKCLENAQFAMEQISRKPLRLLPAKEKYLQDLYEIVANAFIDQKRAGENISESDREKRALILLGLYVSREPSQDSILRVRPVPPRDPKSRERNLLRTLDLSIRPTERCYLLHELARLLLDTKQGPRARYFAAKCQSEARKASLRLWHINATFLLAKCHVLQNNRPDARATLLEGATLARTYGHNDIAAFFETCACMATEGEAESNESAIDKRERALVSLMPDEELRSAAQHLFRRMSAVPAARRFSIMPGTRSEDMSPASGAGRRASIKPRDAQPVRLPPTKKKTPLGFQDFDN